MKYKVNLSLQAKSDIDGIYGYIFSVLGEQQVAFNMLSLLEENILSLDEMPGRYRIYEKEPWKSRGVHIMPVKKYLVFYTVNDEDKTVNVFRVIYGSRNLEDALN